MIRKIVRRIFMLREIVTISLDQSYYLCGVGVRKSFLRRLFDNISWTIKYREVNIFYTLYGFDVHNKDGFIDYKSFFNSRNKLNKVGNPSSQISILRDKFLFYLFMKGINIPVPEVFGIVINGKIYDLNMDLVNINNMKTCDLFIKDIDGECASYVKHISSIEELRKEIEKIDISKKYILQEKVVQNNEMAKINNNSINTYRIVTTNVNGKIEIFSSILRVGTSKTGNVDNWAAGGLAIGINDDGFLKEYGYYKPIYGGRITIHPDSKIKFSEFKAPYFEEACKIALETHKFFYNIHSIGWDIAVSDRGIQIIEGNDNWEISLMQACNGGLRKKWENLL